MPTTTASGLVLAAGAGTRYGRPKILVADWLDRAVAALRDGGCRDVSVVTGAARVTLPDHVDEVHCAGWERGIGASLRTGLEAVGPRGHVIVVHVVDSPDVDAAVVRRLLTAARGALARAVYDGRPGHPVVIPRVCLPALLADLADDDGAGPFLRARSALEVECGDLATGQDQDYADEARRSS